MVEGFAARGWAKFAYEAGVAHWAAAARNVALTRIADPAHKAEWLECEGTWFIGVATLPNGPDGAVDGGAALNGAGYAAARALYGDLTLHAGQVSVVYPGYPRPRRGESEAAFAYRMRRDAAHVDGLLAVGDTRARMLKERHAYILGLPLSEASAEASPLVVWEGSHEIMRAAFSKALHGIAPQDWGEVDLTEIYKVARRDVFAQCPRVPVPARPGEATLIHRLAVHGVAPWGEGAEASTDGRMIAYFRPEFNGNGPDWVNAP